MHEISFINEFDLNIDIPVSPRAEMQNVDVEIFGDFDLDGERFSIRNKQRWINKVAFLEEFWIGK